MRGKRRVLAERLEARHLLSNPTVHINYLAPVTTSSVTAGTEVSGDLAIECYANMPLHVTAVWPTSSTDLGDSDTNAAIKAKWEWDFGDSTSGHNTLEGFNASHIYSSTGSKVL